MSREVGDCFERILRHQQENTGPCNGCPLRGPSPVYGIGDWDSEVFLVAMSPNEKRERKEAYRPEPMVLEEFQEDMIRNWDKVDTSQPGARWDFAPLLDRILKAISSRKEEVYFTNVIKCAVSFDKEEPRAEDKKRDMEGFGHCWLHLKAELEAVQPRLVVTFGQHAASAVQRTYGRRDDIALPGIEEFHGEIYHSDIPATTVLHLIHWSNSHMNMPKVRRDTAMRFEDSASKRLLASAKEAGLW